MCSDMLDVWFNPICCGDGVIQSCRVGDIEQEDLEIKRITVPSSYFRTNYISMEPFLIYNPLLYINVK